MSTTFNPSNPVCRITHITRLFIVSLAEDHQHVHKHLILFTVAGFRLVPENITKTNFMLQPQ